MMQLAAVRLANWGVSDVTYKHTFIYYCNRQTRGRGLHTIQLEHVCIHNN